MSEPRKTEKAKSEPRESVRVRLSKLRQSRQRSVLGLPEIIGLAASTLLLLAVVFAYLYFLTPARNRLLAAQRQRDGLQEQLRTSQEGVRQSTDTQATITEINQSLEDFENSRLTRRDAGRMALYNQLNLLIKRNGLRNTAGPNYTALNPLGTVDAKGQAANKTGNAKWQSVFPGIGVSLTVEGQYANLRRFVRDVEASGQFLIINAVELESVTDNNSADVAAGAAPGAGPTGAARPMLVSLRLDLAVYFQRGALETNSSPEETR
jgi:Tfp pilus assembly protein PilO